MPSFLLVVSSILLVYLSSLAYRLLVNLANAKKSGFPFLMVPLNQNNIVWQVISMPLRPLILKYLPKWFYDRISLTIYGFEFHEGLRPYEQFAAPQGNDMSYAMVTPGKFEISTRDPEIIAEILSRPKDFGVLDLAAIFLGMFGKNVFTVEGDSWSRQRKLVAKVINERISRVVFNESIDQTEGLLEEVIGLGDMGETNRIPDMMKKITLNVLASAGMGSSVGWHAIEEPSPGFKTTYNKAIGLIASNFGPLLLLPQSFLSNYPSFLPGSQLLRSIGHAMKEFPIHTQNMLSQERQRTLAAHGETRSNIMSQLLQASEEGDGDTKGVKALSEEEMLGNLFVFTAAGFDTTANTLCYAIVLMCRYPQWQDWISEEIDAIIPASSASDLDYSAIYPKALRIQALMLEVLRLFPPVIHITKQTHTAQTVQTSRGSFYFPPNTTVYVSTVALHLDATVWRNLNLGSKESRNDRDEFVFRPTRWLNPSSESSQLFKPPKGAYVPWSFGPRICPGQKMAQVEFAAIFMKLFQRCRIEAVRLKTEGGLETRDELDRRLDRRMRDSIPILTLQMEGVYDIADDEKGLKLRLCKR